MSGIQAVAQRLFGERDGSAWPSRRRVCAYAALLLGLEITGLAFFVAGTHGWIVALKGPVSTDFVSFYAAGLLADAGTPALVYQQAAHHAAEQAATQPGIPYNYFYYPPIFILLCALFARLPYLPAFLAFQAATLLPCLLTARRILQQSGWAIMLPLLAFPAVFYTLGTGQNAFLTAALFGAATLLVDRRPVLAGLLFGTLCYKPHFGLLVPVALAAGGRWRAFAAAAITVAALTGLSALAFGWDTWQAFFAAAANARHVYEAGISQAGLTSPFGVVLVLGGRPALAYQVQAAATLMAMASVGVVWWRGSSQPVRAAMLTAATPIALPVVQFYDLMLSGFALAWLVQLGQQRSLSAWYSTVMAMLFVTTLLSGNFDLHSPLMIAPLVAAGTFLLTLVAALGEMCATHTHLSDGMEFSRTSARSHNQ